MRPTAIPCNVCAKKKMDGHKMVTQKATHQSRATPKDEGGTGVSGVGMGMGTWMTLVPWPVVAARAMDCTGSWL